MSLLIKGMEMPKNCDECVFRTKYYGVPWCCIAQCYIDEVSCPLVPVPPHGDLIERKAIGLTDFEIVMCDGDYKEGMKMLLKKIEAAPTIIPAEESKT